MVYAANQNADDVTELFSVPLTGGPSTPLSTINVTGGDVVGGEFEISPDSTRVVYLADQDTDGVFELFSVPVGGGPTTKLNGALVSGGSVGINFRISPNSGRVIYIADQEENDMEELFSVPLAGGTTTKLNPPLVTGGGVLNARISPDSSRAIYQADQELDSVVELFSVPMTGGISTKLSGAMVSGGDVHVEEYKVSPDSSRVIYIADQEIDTIPGIYSVPLTGGSPIKLNIGGSSTALSRSVTTATGSTLGGTRTRMTYSSCSSSRWRVVLQWCFTKQSAP